MPRTDPLRPLTLLGPQRHNPSLAAVFDQLGITGPIAAVTAGWQEREAEVDEMREHLGRPVVNLMLHQRSEELFGEDPALARAYRERQERLKDLQGVYRLRLSPALRAARQVMAEEGEAWLLAPERRSAIQAVRSLDAHHLRRVRAVHAEFAAEAQPGSRKGVARHRRQLAELLAGCQALAIAGGHVAVLLNRLRLFDLLDLAPSLPIVAWSAGAMALGERIVLFHDNPPQGAGDAEVLEAGLGLFRDLLPLPHASQRLRLADPARVALLSRRFSPATPVALDPGARLSRLPNGAWRPAPGTRKLTSRGSVRSMEPAA